MATVREGNQPALVVVDAQVGVIDQSWEGGRIVANIAAAVERARANDIDVVWVQHEDEELVSNSEPWKIVSRLQPQDGEHIIHKSFNSAFEHTNLDAILEKLGISHVVLCGAQTSWCIRATAYGALERGYDLTILTDGHTTSDIEVEESEDNPEGIVLAIDIIAELNSVLTWVSYPGRTSGAAACADFPV